MRINLGADDLARGNKIKEPKWEPCIIYDYKEKPASTDRSTNGTVYFKIIAGENKGAIGSRLYNEKAQGFATPLLIALGAKLVDDGNGKGGKKLEATLSKETLLNKKLDVYFVRGTSNRGNDFNDPKDFAPLGTNSGYKGEA